MFLTPPFDTSGSLIPLGEWGGGEAGRERPEQRRKEMPGIDPPGLARLQEIPVREKCCGLEHLFSFHGGMKPRLSGKGGGRGEGKMTVFFLLLLLLSSGRDSFPVVWVPASQVEVSVFAHQPLVWRLCSSSWVGQWVEGSLSG